MVLKESVAITLSTDVDLAVGCLGVRVATIVGKMKTSFDSSTPILLAILHRMVLALLSRSSE